MIDSKQLIDVTGISRATLNNYVALGILPSPHISAPLTSGDRATRLGFFPDEAIDRIKDVQLLKKQGLSMAEIARQCGKVIVIKAVESTAMDPGSWTVTGRI
jgi:adenylate cyclase